MPMQSGFFKWLGICASTNIRNDQKKRWHHFVFLLERLSNLYFKHTQRNHAHSLYICIDNWFLLVSPILFVSPFSSCMPNYNMNWIESNRIDWLDWCTNSMRKRRKIQHHKSLLRANIVCCENRVAEIMNSFATHTVCHNATGNS